MSKKTKISLIISCIMTLVLAGGIIWFVSAHRDTDDVSDLEAIVLAQNEHEESSANPETCLQTEVEIIASTISEKIEITEATEMEPVQVVEVTASADTPDTTVTIKENNPILAKDTTPKKEESSKTVNNPTTDNKPATTDAPATEKLAGQTKTVNPVSDQTDSSKKPTSTIEPSSTKTMPSGTTKTTEPQEETTTAADKTELQTEAPAVDPLITKNTEGATEKPTETPSCSHKWIWATHTETKTIPAITHQEPVYDDGWDEGITVQKVYCSECEGLYDTSEDFYKYDKCHGNSGLITVIDHYIHHEPELLFYDTITDEPEHKETVIVKDYQYCSLCGELK